MIAELIFLNLFITICSIGYGVISGSTSKIWLYMFIVSWTSFMFLPFFTK